MSLKFNLKWNDFVRMFIPIHKRKPVRLAWLDVIVSGVKNYSWADFYATINKHEYDLQFTGQIKWLEHVLNDRFDGIARGIYIENIADDFVDVFVYNAIEIQPPLYVYNTWQALVSYLAGQFTSSVNKIYSALTNSTNLLPASFPLAWQYENEDLFILNTAEIAGLEDFIVWVPVVVVFDISEMKKLINKYKLSGKQYTIQTY